MAVPIQQRHDISGLDSRRRQGVGEPLDPLVERPIVVAQLVGVNDLLLGLMAHPRQQQILDQQWVVVGALRRRNYFCFQHGCTSWSRRVRVLAGVFDTPAQASLGRGQRLHGW
ncbi:hypothetical protein D9M71_609430 [compost metagenome]